MNEPRYTSWRYSPGAPGIGVTPSGAVDLVADDLALRQSILLLIATIPGERVMRPAYGCPLDQLVFASNDDTTAGLAIYAVRTAIERWEPRVEIVSLDAGRDPDNPAALLVTLAYRAKASGATGVIAVTTAVGG